MTPRSGSLKILVVCQYYYPEPFRVSDICESLAILGHDVTVLTGLPNYPEGEVLPEYRHGKRRTELLNGVNVIRCPEIGRGRSRIRLLLNYLSFAISATLTVSFIKKNCDVVFVNQLSPVFMSIPGIAYKKQHRKKMLLYCLDLWPASLSAGGISEYSSVYGVLRTISRWIYRSADTILVSSSMFQDYLEHELEIKDVNVRHVPQYGEDILTRRDEKTSDLDSPLGGRKYNFVFAGNVGEVQSVETIVRAANEVRNRTDIGIHIVGDGSQLEACRGLSNDLGLTNLTFHGRRPLEDMPEFFRMADAMLVTMKRDEHLSYTLPGKVQSYMAAGRPILGAIDGETSRVIQMADCGYACEAEDYREFSRLVVRFCDDGAKDQMAANALNFYSEHFSKEQFLSTLIEELEKLAG
jgi:glycosyltransferase involved in cell wall biosynthesis